VRIECEWSNETNARRYHSSHTREMLFWQMRVFLNAIKSFTRFTLSKYDPKLVCTAA